MATRTLTEYHMGVALTKMGLTTSTREIKCGDAVIRYLSTATVAGSAVRLPGGDWRVTITPVRLGDAFSVMSI